jgi:hypothetical protein
VISYYQDAAGRWHFRGTADPLVGPHSARDCAIPDSGPYAALADAIAVADELRGERRAMGVCR